MVEALTIFSIGHSNRAWREFLDVLVAWRISAIADVRSSPFSARNPHFNRPNLADGLASANIEYRFLGSKLGGRPSCDELYTEGVADYEKMAREPKFEIGIKKIIEGAKKHRIALLCSEHEPMDCHRALLVSRSLYERTCEVTHIISKEKSIAHQDLEAEILRRTGDVQADFLAPKSDPRASAYREWSSRVAFSRDAEYRRHA